jgi:mono/diheme cytochrome c family protein
MVTEVPDYLLQRSRERRAALGLGGDEGDGGAITPAGDGGGSPATTSAASATPAVAAPAPIAPGVPDPGPAPVPPNVQAALRRKRVPIWALPVVALLPLWGYAYAGTLEPPTSDALTALQLGEEVYGKCSTCHGADGGGNGSIPALTSVGDTFSDPTDHAKWVFLGSTGWSNEVGDTYGDGNTPIGSGGMPAWGADLTPEELLSVIAYERGELSGLDVTAEGLVDEEGNLLVTYDEEQGVLVDIATGEPAEITPEG